MLRRKSVKPYTNRNGIQLKLVLREFKGFLFFSPFSLASNCGNAFPDQIPDTWVFLKWQSILYFISKKMITIFQQPKKYFIKFFFSSHIKFIFQIWQIDRTELLTHRRPYQNDLGDTNQWDAKINNYICYASI